MVLAAARLFTPVLRRSLLPVTCSVRKVGGSTQLRAEQLGLRSDQALWLALQVTHWASIAGVLAVPGILKRGQYCGEKGKGKIQSPASYRTLTGQASGFVWLRFPEHADPTDLPRTSQVIMVVSGLQLGLKE